MLIDEIEEDLDYLNPQIRLNKKYKKYYVMKNGL